MTTLNGKKIWLIGASEGIGEALARALAAEGAELCISARSTDKLKAIVTSMPGKGHFMVAVDVTTRESVDTAWKEVISQWGAPDTVIYNAGAYDPMGAKAFQFDAVMRMVNVNFEGALRVLACVLPPFVARNGGHIVLVGSVAGYSGLTNAMGYGASKAAVLHLAENLRADFATTAIKVQLVSPGFVKTRLTSKNSFPMPFMISPEEAASHIVKGMQADGFEIRFPWQLVYILKFLRLLPYRLYFGILKAAKI